MSLGLGSTLKKSGVITPGIITDNLVMKHNYATNGNIPVSDGAAYFDASNSHVQLTDPFNHTNITVSAWVYRIDDGNTQIVFSNQDDANDGFSLFITDDEHVRCKVNSTTSDEVTGTLIVANTWNHVAATVTDNSIIKVYVIGVFADDKSLSGSIASATNARIGLSAFDNTLDHKGYICNVGVWSSVLIQAQIKSIMWKNYADLTSTETDNLVSWWNLSADANDSHGSNNGTLS